MKSALQRWPAAAIWLAAGALLAVLDGRVDLANLAMLLVLASVLASLWLPMGVAAGASLAAVLAFNWALVPPRRSFGIANLEHHAPLLLTILALSWISAGLMGRLRRQAQAAQHHAAVADQLRAFGETLRDAAEPRDQAEALRTADRHARRRPAHRPVAKPAPLHRLRPRHAAA